MTQEGSSSPQQSPSLVLAASERFESAGEDNRPLPRLPDYAGGVGGAWSVGLLSMSRLLA